MQIISHKSPHYHNIKPNGALIYSINICKYIIPRIKTDRNWVTINTHQCFNHSIVFIHSNVNLDILYSHLSKYKDLILVCSQKSTMMKMRKYGHAIYLPLSIDVEYVKQFERLKYKGTCYAGRNNKMNSEHLKHKEGVDYLCDYTHDGLLEEMAKYKRVYAVGLTALEAKCLNCEILPYDPRFPDPSVWVVRDCKDMATVLQEKLYKIDGRKDYQSGQIIIDTTNPTFIRKNEALKKGKFNGAYYYSQEIVKNIIPYVKTERPWDTLTMREIGTVDGAICFLHQCIEMDKAYDWLKDYEDLVLVASSPYVYDWAIKNGYKAIYLPLSIDIEYVKQFKKKRHTKNACFCGNIWKFREQEIAETIPDDVDFQQPNICREELLKFMSDYKYVYAIGRCALEAQALGAKILQCYKKFPVEHWKLIDNKEAAKILQEELDKIDERK